MTDSITQQLGTNPRLRAGIAAILAILALYLLLGIADYNQQLEEEYLAAARKANTLQDIRRRDEWLMQAEQMQAQLVDLQARLWQADSSALAQAAVQSWLGRKLKRLRLDELDYTVASVKQNDTKMNLWEVSSQIQGALNLNGVVELVRLVETQKKLLRIDQMTLNRSGKQYQLKMMLTAYFQVSESDQ